MRLHPDVVVAWRNPGTVQIGLDDGTGLIVQADQGTAARLIEALRTGEHSLEGLRALGQRCGLSPALVEDLVGRLSERGALLRATPRLPRDHDLRLLVGVARSATLRYPGHDGWEVLERRRRARVLLDGVGPSTADLARLLLAAGVGRVWVHDPRRLDHGDLGDQGRDLAAVGRARHHVLSEQVSGVQIAKADIDADFAVLSGDCTLDPSTAHRHVRDERAHLAVLMRERDAVVGPLVRPGRTACLHCVDLYRAQRDPDWPKVVAQARAHRFGPRDPVLSARVAALAASEVLLALDGCLTPLSEGATVEVGLDSPVPIVRDWPLNPECGCDWVGQPIE